MQSLFHKYIYKLLYQYTVAKQGKYCHFGLFVDTPEIVIPAGTAGRF